jgi:hypothetical protein
MATSTFSLVLLVDANGEYAVGKDSESAIEAYENDIGSLGESGGFRLLNLEVKAPLPEQVELTGTVPAAEGKATLTIK